MSGVHFPNRGGLNEPGDDINGTIACLLLKLTEIDISLTGACSKFYTFGKIYFSLFLIYRMSLVNRRGVIKSLTTSSALFTTLSMFPQKGKTASNLDEATMLSMGDKYRLDSGEDVSFLNGLVKHSFYFIGT